MSKVKQMIESKVQTDLYYDTPDDVLNMVMAAMGDPSDCDRVYITINSTVSYNKGQIKFTGYASWTRPMEDKTDEPPDKDVSELPHQG